MSRHNLRKKVVETARRMLEEGLVHGTWGNVSCRIPGESFMIITPSGIDYLRMEPDDTVIVDWEGNLVEGRWKPSTESILHARIYQMRPEVGAVVHTHSTHATAFAIARQPIPVVTEEMAQVVGGMAAVANYATCGTEGLAKEAVKALGRQNAVLLANHGLVGVGRNLNEALRTCIIVEKTARAVILARLLGGYTELGSEEVKELRTKFINEYGQKK